MTRGLAFSAWTMAGLISMVSLAPEAHAGDSKSYDSTNCTSYLPWFHSDFFASGFSGNSSGGSTIQCPIVRDNTINTTGLLDLELYVRSANGGSFSCTAFSKSHYGNVLKSVTRSTSASTDTTLSWGSTVNVSSAFGLYMISCIVPSGAGFYGYYADEP